MCGATQRLQLSHIYPRGAYPWIMFDLSNVLIHCLRCHLYIYHRSPLDAVEWLKTVFSDKQLAVLREKAKLPKEKRPIIDYEQLEIDLRKKL